MRRDPLVGMGPHLVTIVFTWIINVYVWSSLCLPEPLVAAPFIEMGYKGCKNLCVKNKGWGDAICKAGNDWNPRIKTIPSQQGLAQTTVPAYGVYSVEHRMDHSIGSRIFPAIGEQRGRVNQSLAWEAPGKCVNLRGQRRTQFNGLLSPGWGEDPAGLRPLPLCPGAVRIHPPQRELPVARRSAFRQYPDGNVMAAIRDSQAMGTTTGIPCERGCPDLLGCRDF